MSHSKPEYPGSITFDDVKNHCIAFGDNVCPYAKIVAEKKGIASNCPAFKDGCPFKDLKCIEDYQVELGKMRDQHKAKGNAAAVEFFREVVRCSKQKGLDVGSTGALFNTISGCPFAKDTSGKPIFPANMVVWPWSLTMEDIMVSCPAFGKGVCPYISHLDKFKGKAGKCPKFREGCPFKRCKTVGEIVELLSQMRESKPSLAAYKEIDQLIHDIYKQEEKKLGTAPFANVCPFGHDPEGKAIIPK